YTGEGKEELAIGKRVLRVGTVDDSRQQVGASVMRGEPAGPAPCSADINCAFDLAVDDVRCAPGDGCIGKRRELSLGIIAIARQYAGQALRKRFRNLTRVSRHPNSRSVDTRAAGVFCN